MSTSLVAGSITTPLSSDLPISRIAYDAAVVLGAKVMPVPVCVVLYDGPVFMFFSGPRTLSTKRQDMTMPSIAVAGRFIA